MNLIKAICEQLEIAVVADAGIDVDELDSDTLAIAKGSVVVIAHHVGSEIYVSAFLDRGGAGWNADRVTEPVMQTFGSSDVEQIFVAVRELLR